VKVSELTEEQWSDIALRLHRGDTQRAVALDYQISPSSFRGSLRTREMGIERGRGKVTQRFDKPTNNLFPPGVFKHLDRETDPVDILMAVQTQLLGLTRVYAAIMTAGEGQTPHADSQAERNLIGWIQREGFKLKDYIGVLKHIGAISVAHLPYRHPKLAALTIAGNTLEELSAMTAEQKIKELDKLLAEAGVVSDQ